ncbi:PREDICTED: myb family transcription factor EFM-like isoform X2 [Ipomoea nil]|uniref:myb family transcription factor EFM-like isoform X2 n=1 Tax=Ipomoea nil TaxID=35883 RepID=UPI000901691B|nr:PREDICTED: myb family transcription factor EFM-like isoform X2 [Ipomoea nil]
MMASSSELSLDCKPQHSYSMLLKSFGDQQQTTTDHHQTSQKLEEFLARLEEERLKIDAFKRELPLCMQLLTNAMEASRQQLQSYKANNQGGTRPVLEEFIPLKNSSSSCDNNGGAEKMAMAAANMASDKANWMTSAQLWSDQGNEGAGKKQHPSIGVASSPKENEIIGFSMSPKAGNLEKRNNNNNGGGGPGAFLPFSKDRSSSGPPAPTLALASSCEDNVEADKKNNNNNVSEIIVNNPPSKANNHSGDASSMSQPDGQTTSATAAAAAATQPQRKARRCWSPDLHRRFVNALQMLGGSQVATPKQIRELMKVDGLTNDEVKSHLQKYRLHTRRPIPSPQTAATGAPQLVVLGGIWVPPEYATAAATHSGSVAAATLYGAHPTVHAQQHYCATAAPQVAHHEFYAAPPPPPLHQLHQPLLHHHHQLHMYKPPSHAHTHSSPVSGDRSESIEDGKSSASGGSWKGDSGSENGGGERKVLVLREEGEVGNNGTEISLKF